MKGKTIGIEEGSKFAPLIPVILKMKNHNIKQCRVEFYGCGDSGSIESVEFDKDPPEELKVRVEKPNFKMTFDEEKGRYIRTVYPNTVEFMPFERGIEDIVYQMLDAEPVDWYNNEGGGGHLTIDLRSDKPGIEFHVYYNEIVSRSAVDDFEELTL